MYWKNKTKDIRALNDFGLSTLNDSGDKYSNSEFYELELGLVLDIILDINHPIFKENKKINSKIDTTRWPPDLNGKYPSKDDKDLTWIGRILVRPLFSEPNTQKDQLQWAFPLETNISEYPLINESVILIRQGNQIFYTKKLNIKNWINNNLDFGIENTISGNINTTLYSTNPFSGSISITKKDGGTNYQGIAGNYFIANNNIRSVKRYEGDMIIESRFGQSIHFLSYDNNRLNDKGDPKNKDYINTGNPMILIRNRQRPLVAQGSILQPPIKKLPPIKGTEEEKNTGGYIEEDINNDGSSIYITSGLTNSKWVTSCYKSMFGQGEEVKGFDGNTTFKYPILNGDQIVINSDRLVFSSRYGETFHYSKKRYGIVTDNEYTVDSHQQMVFTTNTKTVFNSPAIYLGEYNNTNEPALLGQTTVNWLYELCDWLLEHTHNYHHSHTNAGKESPSTTQLPVEVQELLKLRDNLKSLMSKRVFITGGGFAPGQDGGDIKDGSSPIKINTSNGNGIPGGWKGENFR